MRRCVYWRAAAFVVAGFGGCLGFSTTDLGFIGVSSAQARSYFTRKRVNGEWITGRFPKRSFAKRQAAPAEPARKRVPRRSAGPATTAALATQSISKAEAPRAPIARELQIMPAPITTPISAAEPMTAPAPASAAPLVPRSDQERLAKLRDALQARANALTTTTGTIAPLAAPQPAPEPQSVSLDFQTGIKTTVFRDGTSVSEPFDIGALKSLASPAPAVAAKQEASTAR